MKSLAVFAAVAVALFCSTASAAWPYGGATVVVGSPTVVQSFYPVGPVYAYPAPVVVYRPSVVVAPRTVYRPSVVVAPQTVYRPSVVVPAPVVVRPKVYVLGQPVRNVVRAVLP